MYETAAIDARLVAYKGNNEEVTKIISALKMAKDGDFIAKLNAADTIKWEDVTFLFKSKQNEVNRLFALDQINQTFLRVIKLDERYIFDIYKRKEKSGAPNLGSKMAISPKYLRTKSKQISHISSVKGINKKLASNYYVDALQNMSDAQGCTVDVQ
ncbi:hypothetical protein [Pedobacter sp. MW01-1-1]|uniref:hypothetical protein n=1 Tax=Pedobacter sp. MW01-1-1 TaxID=3383027 RepID=UPI003FEFE972